MRELFIYYRMPAVHAFAARTAVDDFQGRLRARHPGLAARLLRRFDDEISPQTWMEIYSFDAAINPAGVSVALQSEIEREAGVLAPYIDGARHIEVFIPCAS